jgi:hypothetical protein
MPISRQPPYRIFSSDFFYERITSSMNWPEAHANGEGGQYVFFFGSMEAVTIFCFYYSVSLDLELDGSYI